MELTGKPQTIPRGRNGIDWEIPNNSKGKISFSNGKSSVFRKHFSGQLVLVFEGRTTIRFFEKRIVSSEQIFVFEAEIIRFFENTFSNNI